MTAPLARFDGAAVWATLDPEHQAAIGAAALELVAFWALQDRVFEDGPQLDPRVVRVEDATIDFEFTGELRERVVAAYPQDGRWEAADGVTPLIPSGVGQICRECGCTANDACYCTDSAVGTPRCSWVEPDLCSACQTVARQHITEEGHHG